MNTITGEFDGVKRAKPRLVIVGNGMATGRLLDEILRRDPHKFDITIIGDEVQGSYNRIMLSPVLAAETEVASIIQKSPQWYLERGMHFIAGPKVINIHSQAQCVALTTGDTVHYDTLVLALGSRPAQIVAGNQHLAHIYSFRTIDDVERITAAARVARSAMVVGGGLLGLEAAYGLACKGSKVTLVHRSGSLLNRQLDSASGDFLRQVMAEKNIQFKLSSEVEHFIGDTAVKAAQLSNGERIECDLVVIATGITPNKELAEAAGIACNRAVCVDDYMATSDPCIHAIGECCEHRDNTFGLVEPIWNQCITLAEKLCFGNLNAFTNPPVATKLKVSGVQVYSAGEYITRPPQRELVVQDARRKIYRKLIVEEDRIVGIVLFGDTSAGNEYFQLMTAGVDISNALPNILLGKAFVPDIESLLVYESEMAA